MGRSPEASSQKKKAAAESQSAHDLVETFSHQAMEGIHIVPTPTLNSNCNLIDWRDRDQFPPDEPVTIWGSDTGDNLRSR